MHKLTHVNKTQVKKERNNRFTDHSVVGYVRKCTSQRPIIRLRIRPERIHVASTLQEVDQVLWVVLVSVNPSHRVCKRSWVDAYYLLIIWGKMAWVVETHDAAL